MATEVRVAIQDVPMGGMKQVESGDAKALFVRDEAGVRAFQTKCPHYGAPLAKGEICGGTLYCPWHKAAFSVADGTLVEPPALERLDRYAVRLEDGDAIATLEDVPPPAREESGRETHVLIVGTGAAGVAAVTALRAEGFVGRITMVGREGGEPYDRPKLSKNFLAKSTEPSTLALSKTFYASHDVEFVHGEATSIDPLRRSATVGDRTITGDMMLVATGSAAVTPDIPGMRLEGVYTLRSLADAIALSEKAGTSKTVAVIGNGFIGIEAAAFLTKRGLKATVIAPQAVPYADRFGEEVGAALKRYHESQSVSFKQGTVQSLIGERAASAVELEDGTRIDADLVLVGAGARPESGALVGATTREDGGVEVGDDLSIAPNVWLAGDIAAFPEPRSGEVARIEHWRLAEQQGMHAAHAMLGRTAPFRAAPFFWSNQGDKRLDYVGYASGWDRILTKGDVEGLDFISYYIKDETVLAACSIGRNPEIISFLHRLSGGEAPVASDYA